MDAGEPTWTPGEPTWTPSEPAYIDFTLDDWDYEELPGDIIALSRPNKLLRADFYSIPSYYNGKRLQLGTTGYNGNFTFADKIKVRHLKVGTSHQETILLADTINPLYRHGLFFDIRDPTIKSIDFEGLDVSTLTNMSGLFIGCDNLESINVSYWDVSHVEDMSDMFSGCTNASHIGVASWDMKKVKTMESMFSGCKSLTFPNFIGAKCNNSVDMSYMFLNCESLEKIEILCDLDFMSGPEYDNGQTSTNMSFMFSGCTNLKSLKGIENWNVSNVKNMNYMFYGCEKINSLEYLKNWDVSNVKDMTYTFGDCFGITSLKGLENWDVSNVEILAGTFQSCHRLMDISALEDWSDKTGKIIDTTNLFSACTVLSNIDSLRNWNMSNVENMTTMFSFVPNIESLEPLKNWNVSNVQEFQGAFMGCLGLKDLKGLEKWELKNARSIVQMFALCRNIEDFTAIENWQMPHLYDLRYAFFGCDKLKSLDMSKWQFDLNAEKIDMHSMFNRCSNLQFLDLSLLDNYQGTLVFDSMLNTIGKYNYDMEYQEEIISMIKSELEAAYPGVDVSAKYPVEVEDYFPGERNGVPLMVLSNHEELRNSLNSSLDTGRVQYFFIVIYDGNGMEFKTRATTHDELISGSHLAYSNNQAVVDDFVAKINAKGSELVTDPDIEWYLDSDCTIPLNTFDFMQQDKKIIHVYAKSNSLELNNAPVIHASDLTLVVGDDFDPLQGVSATDLEDGQIKDILVIDDNVDTSKPGVYQVSYKVVDSKGIYTIKTIFVTVHLSAEKINRVPTIHASDLVIVVGADFNPLQGVSATDDEDGEIKDIVVIEDNVDTSKPGVYYVTYKVVDSLGACRMKTVSVTVKLGSEQVNHAPIILANDITLTVGDEFEPLKDVRATDYEDGVIKDIKVVENNVDTSKAGTYKVTYQVVDSQGAKCLKSIYVVVNVKADKLNHVPVINATDATLNVGDKFDALKDVSATDKEDGKLDHIEVIENNVDVSKPGLYEVVYKVTDRDGASVCKTIKVTVLASGGEVTPPTADYTNPSVYLMISGLALVALCLLKKKKLKA